MRNEIKELEPGILFYGKAAKTSAYGFGLLLGPSEKSTKHRVYGYGLVLGPNEHKPQYWQVRCITYNGDDISCSTQDVMAKSLKEDWPKLYEWVT